MPTSRTAIHHLVVETETLRPPAWNARRLCSGCSPPKLPTRCPLLCSPRLPRLGPMHDTGRRLSERSGRSRRLAIRNRPSRPRLKAFERLLAWSAHRRAASGRRSRQFSTIPDTRRAESGARKQTFDAIQIGLAESSAQGVVILLHVQVLVRNLVAAFERAHDLCAAKTAARVRFL